MERRIRHRAGQPAVLLLAFLLLIDAAMPLWPGAFRLQAAGSIEAAAAPANGSASEVASPLRATPRPARVIMVTRSGSPAPTAPRRLVVSDRPPVPRLAYPAEPAPAQSSDDD